MRESTSQTDDPLEDLLASCLEGDSAENAIALDRACAEHPEHAEELRRRVECLVRLGLGHVQRTQDYPERLGEFVLLERLGGGGMGVVFRARQEPLGRLVALKVIRAEQLYFPRARERFRRETEVVARLQHPGIVPIYTVGEEGGVPYFAMEFVPGCSLSELLSELQGRAPERLRGEDVVHVLQRKAVALGQVFEAPERVSGPWISLCLRWVIEVAEALEHAHQRGVLHRDVKPSNIVITLDGHARLLDFGLASLGDEGDARLTASGATLGSLLYMAPEQARGESKRASERSDVYALGVTLYELLCLQAPYRDASMVDLRNAIIDGRIDALRARNRAVSRDLEVVCMKAMESAPSRRYGSAAALARDLANVLEHRPIEARPPSAVAKAVRWVQRNPAAGASLALGLAVVVGVPSTLLWQERKHAGEMRVALDAALVARREADLQRESAQQAERSAAQERDRALQAEAEAAAQRDQARREAVKAAKVSELLMQLFTGAGPGVARGRELTARDLLDAGRERLERDLAAQPEVLAELLDAIGTCYTSISEYEKAERSLLRSLELRLELYGERSLHVADSYYDLAHLWRVVGDKRALGHARLALDLQVELAPEDLERRVQRHMCVASSAITANDFPLAMEHMTQARDLLEQMPDASADLRGNVLSNLANTLFRSGRHEEAVQIARESIAFERSLGDEPHPGITSSLNALALSLKHLKRLEESLAVYDELLPAARQLHGERNDRYATFVLNRASLLEELGDDAQALEALEYARTIFDETTPPTHPQRITAYGNLGGLCARTGRWAQGRAAFESILPQMIESLGPQHARVALSRYYLGQCCEGMGDASAAEGMFSAALKSTLANYGDSDPRGARIGASLAALLTRGEAADGRRARELAESALKVAGGRGQYTTVTATAALALARLELGDGELERARAYLADAVRAGEIARPDHWSAFAARAELSRLSADDTPAAREEGERMFAALVERLGPSHVECAHVRSVLDR